MGLRGRQWLIAGLVAVLTVGIFLFDILTPRGLTNQVLYLIPLLISFLSPVVAFPLVVASVCSLLTIAGLFLSPDVFNIRTQEQTSNREEAADARHDKRKRDDRGEKRNQKRD